MVLRKFWQKIGKTKSPSSGMSFKRIPFTPEDIELLEDRAQSRRSGDSTHRPVPGSLPEILRGVGHYLHSKGAILLKLVKKEREIVIEYETRRGQRKTEEYDVTSFYDYSLKSYLQRSMVNYL